MALDPMSIERLVREYQHRQEEQRKEQVRCKTRNKIFRRLTIIGMILLCFSLWKGPEWYKEFAKRRMAFRFLQAVLNKDGRTLYELTAPEERERSKLTPEKAAAVMERLLVYLGDVKPVRIERESPLPRPKERVVELPSGAKYLIFYPDIPTFLEERTWIVYWGDQTGKPLPSWWAQKGDKFSGEIYLTSRVLIVKLKSGFWVDFGYFIISTCTSKWGKEEGLKMAGRIWWEADFAVKQGGKEP